MEIALVRAAEKNSETPSQLVDTSRIADYKSIGNQYQDYAVQAYSMGMISGTDKQGIWLARLGSGCEYIRWLNLCKW